MSIRVDEEDILTDDEDIPIFEHRDVTIRQKGWVTDDFQILEFLGRGKFGEVKRCQEKSSGTDFAAKFIAAPTPQDKREVEHEIEVMKRLKHRRLLQLYDAYASKKEMCLVLELVHGGELFDRVICDDFILTERACVVFVRQICEGVAYIHSQNIIHLDMKPENILCLSKTGNRIKIIDFGLARVYNPKKDLRVLFGTPEFMAPEVVQYEPIDYATDMWSIGVICYVLLSGLSPFMGDSDGETLTNIIKGEYDFDYPEFEEVSEEAKDLINQLLKSDRKKRLTASECLEHPWLARRKPLQRINLRLSKKRLKRFVHRRKWQKIVNTLVALKRMGVDITSLKGRSLLTSPPELKALSWSDEEETEQKQPPVVVNKIMDSVQDIDGAQKSDHSRSPSPVVDRSLTPPRHHRQPRAASPTSRRSLTPQHIGYANLSPEGGPQDELLPFPTASKRHTPHLPQGLLDKFSTSQEDKLNEDFPEKSQTLPRTKKKWEKNKGVNGQIAKTIIELPNELSHVCDKNCSCPKDTNVASKPAKPQVLPKTNKWKKPANDNPVVKITFEKPSAHAEPESKSPINLPFSSATLSRPKLPPPTSPNKPLPPAKPPHLKAMLQKQQAFQKTLDNSNHGIEINKSKANTLQSEHPKTQATSDTQSSTGAFFTSKHTANKNDSGASKLLDVPNHNEPEVATSTTSNMQSRINKLFNRSTPKSFTDQGKSSGARFLFGGVKNSPFAKARDQASNSQMLRTERVNNVSPGDKSSKPEPKDKSTARNRFMPKMF